MILLDWMIIDAILLTLVFCLFILIFLPKFLFLIMNRTKLIRTFLKENDGGFNFIFIIVLAFEQGVLLYFTYRFGGNIENLKIIISAFAILVLTTTSIQTAILQTKMKYDREDKVIAKKDLDKKLENINSKLYNTIDGFTEIKNTLKKK